MDPRVLGAILSIVLISLAFRAIEPWMDTAHDARVAQSVAAEAEQIEVAAQHYVNTYTSQVEAATSPTQVATVTVPMLITTGFLPAGFTSVNPYGQTWVVEILQPSPGQLQAIVTTTGGTVLKDQQANGVVADLGSSGGFYPKNDSGRYQPNKLYFVQGQLPIGSYSIAQGSVADWVNLSDADESWNYLYRNAVPGNPEANTMNTPLIMAAVETSGGACGSTGAIAQDGTGALVTCQGGLWTEVAGTWKAPVATYATLPVTGNSNGDVRLTKDTDRAFAWNGSQWNALAVDQNGNLTVPNSITAGNGNVQIGNAGFGSFITMNSNSGENYSFVSQNNYMTLWNGNGGYSVFKAQSNGEWDSDEGSFCLNGAGNGSYDCNSSWGFQPRYGSGWSMVTSVNGALNAQAEVAPGSIHANDYYDRATGEWFSQVANAVSNQQYQINSLNNAYNSLSSESSYQQTEISSLQSQLNGEYVGSFGPASSTSGSSGGWLIVNGGYTSVNCQGRCGPTLPPRRLLIIVTGIVGGNNNPEGASWGGLSEPCNSNQVGVSMLAYVNGIQVGDMALSKSPSANYATLISTENTFSFIVPAGSSFSMSMSSGCGSLRGTIWEI